MESWKKFFFKLSAVLVSAFLLACSFPLPPALKTMEGASAALLGLIPLIIVVRLSRPKSAFWWGWLCGFMFWLVSLSWILQLRNTWACAPWVALPIIIFSWAALAAYCALYMGLFGFLLARVFPVKFSVDSEDAKRGLSPLHRLGPVLLAPVIWIGCEYLRSVIGTGFPWNLLGVSQYQNIAAIQLAAWGGVYAVSGLIVLLNAALAMTALRVISEVRYRKKRGRIHYELMLGLIAVAMCWSFGVRRVKLGDAAAGQLTSVRVAAVQPCIPQPQKWSEQYRCDAYSALQSQSELAVMSKPQLMIWPETAIPDILTVDPMAQRVVGRLVAENMSILVGSMDFEQHGDRIDYYNSSFLVDSGGHIESSYRKRHLVPFGEYLPFENQILLIKKMAPLGFSCLPGHDQELMRLPIGGAENIKPAFGTLICFEDIFPYLARRDVKNGARFLVNQTNDGWFEHSAASRQHMANAVFRAVENRVPLVRCANTGVTCFIDRFGRILEKLASRDGSTELRGFSVSEIQLELQEMPPTVYTRFGDWILAIPCAMVVFGLLGWGIVSRKKHKNPQKR